MTDLSSIRLTGADTSLTRAVLRSPRLSAMLPQAEIAELATAYKAATAAVEAAAKLPTEEVDVLGLLDADMRAGKAVDPADLIAKLAEANAKNEQRERAIRELSTLPTHYRTAIVGVVERSVVTFYDMLGEQLAAVLDEAAALLVKMPGVTDSDSALDAGKAKEWQRFRELGRQYADIRSAHLDLLRAEDPVNLAIGSSIIGFAFFENVEAVVPNYVRVQRRITDPQYAGFRQDPLPWPANDPADPAHWLAVVRDRARLAPYIGEAAWAVDKHGPALERVLAESDPMPTPMTSADRPLATGSGSIGQVVLTPRMHR